MSRRILIVEDEAPIRDMLCFVLEQNGYQASVAGDFDAAINQLVKQLQANKSVQIEIRGHTDNIGEEAKNQILSEQRAKAVLDYLVSQGIEAKRLSYHGFGSTQPIASNDTNEGRTKNRRVEFLKVE